MAMITSLFTCYRWSLFGAFPALSRFIKVYNNIAIPSEHLNVFQPEMAPAVRREALFSKVQWYRRLYRFKFIFAESNREKELGEKQL